MNLKALSRLHAYATRGYYAWSMRSSCVRPPLPLVELHQLRFLPKREPSAGQTTSEMGEAIGVVRVPSRQQISDSAQKR